MDSISVILLVVGGFMVVLSLLLKNSNFLDVRSIFAQHFRVFKGNPLQLIGVFVVPAIFAVNITLVRGVDQGILNNLNIVLSILTAMFFSVLSILSTFDKEGENEKYLQLLKETVTTTIFEIIICLLLLLVSFIMLFIGDFEKSLTLEVISGIIYYLSIVAILNILIIIKRLKVLFDYK